MGAAGKPSASPNANEALFGAMAMMPPDEDELAEMPAASRSPLRPVPTPLLVVTPVAPARATPSPSASVPCGIESLPVLELARVEAPVTSRTTPRPVTRRSPTTGTPTMRIRYPQESKDRLSTAVTVCVIAAVVSVVASIYYLVFTRTHDGHEETLAHEAPALAVKSFYRTMLAGNLRGSVQFLHPRYQGEAMKRVKRFEKERVPAAAVARKVTKALGRGAVELDIGSSKRTGPESWKVELVLSSGGAPLRSQWMEVKRFSGQWYVDANPFAEKESTQEPI